MTSFSVSGFAGIISLLLPEPHAGLLAGLLFGTKATLPGQLYDALIRSGTIHIVALSGMNIAILSRLVQGNLMWLVGRRISCLLTLLIICWFVWFVGPGASIVRAAIMGGVSLIAVLLGRQYWAIGSWILAVVVMLLINRAWIGDVSFQLSVLATLGIIVFYSDDRGESGAELAGTISQNRYPVVGVLRRAIRDNLRLTMAAQICTIPVILYHFRTISLVSPITNLLIGWIIAPLTALGWLTVLLGLVVLPLAQIVAWFDWLALEYIVRTVYLMSIVPLASVGQ